MRIAAADIGGRGYADIITAPGPSSTPEPIKYFDGQTSVNYYSFFPVGFNMAAGAFVAAADVYGDGRADVLISAGSGAQSMIINYFTTSPAVGTTPPGTGIRVTNYLPFDNANSNGVQVSTADYELIGKPDIVLLTVDNSGRTLEKIINPLTALTVFQFPA